MREEGGGREWVSERRGRREEGGREWVCQRRGGVKKDLLSAAANPSKVIPVV